MPPSRLVLRNKGGVFLVAEVHPVMSARLLQPTIGLWKTRCVQQDRPASLLIEPFGVYFWSGPDVIARNEAKEPALTLSFGDPWDEGQPASELILGGTHYLWAMAGIGSVDPETLDTQAEAWLRKLRGQASKYLPPCPGTVGIARLWLSSLMKAPELAVEPVPGVGHKMETGAKTG